MSDGADANDSVSWWPKSVRLSQSQRLMLAVVAVAVIGGIAIGVLGMIGALGGWAKGVGYIAVVVGALVELVPLMIHWYRRTRTSRG